MDKETATKVLAKLQQTTALLDSSVRDVLENSTETEFRAYREHAGRIMGEVFVELIRPIHQEHPNLVPPELRAQL